MVRMERAAGSRALSRFERSPTGQVRHETSFSSSGATVKRQASAARVATHRTGLTASDRCLWSFTSKSCMTK